MPKRDKNSRHYVDNKEFLVNITEYRETILAAKEDKSRYDPEAEEWIGEKPRVTNYLGECFVKIANHLAYNSNFVNYTFRDEMILDGIENCITYIDNFNPAKSKNPFAYFTQITYYAFIRRIQKEKRQLETKLKYIQNSDIDSVLSQEHDGDTHTNEYLQYIRKQVDEAQKHHEDYKNENAKIPKRRPKYLDDKQALEMAKEKIPALKENT